MPPTKKRPAFLAAKPMLQWQTPHRRPRPRPDEPDNDAEPHDTDEPGDPPDDTDEPGDPPHDADGDSPDDRRTGNHDTEELLPQGP